ncbi:ShlB/FhaC/HecB family hemolysin secretion/activation protein [Pandoraea sp. NPDC090278]|uniref:ShlB/FhaC/HecB family hemolysin secretion/activation protein n=1 Tax=Pandoraea sp. NPDC090278 TaxID=3364391 RepID=UPI00383A1DEE
MAYPDLPHHSAVVSHGTCIRFISQALAIACFGALIGGLALHSETAVAQTPPQIVPDSVRQGIQDERLERQRREAQERQHRADAPDVHLSAPADGTESPIDTTQLPTEAPCVPLTDITITGPDGDALPSRFAPIATALSRFVGQCAGTKGIALIASLATDAVLANGWVTTRVSVPEQDLAGGRLTLHLIVGRISSIRFADDGVRGSWRSAFPLGESDILSIQGLEQGLEQLKRMPSQDADIRIEPGKGLGTSDVLIDVQRRRPWRLLASVDNSGTRDTGRLQGQLAIGIDNPLGLNDLLDLSAQHDLSTGDDRFGTKGGTVSYSAPWGYSTVSVFGSTRTYFQRIAGANETFVSSGRNQTAELRVERVVHRDSRSKTTAEARIGRRFGKSFIEDFEISQQYRNNTYLQLGIARRRYLGAAQADLALSYRQGMPWFGAQDDLRDPVTHQPTPQTYRYRMFLADVQWSAPIRLGGVPLRLTGTFHGQTTANALWAVDQMAIGGRYSVRGFTGDQTLSAARGFFLRHDIHVPLAMSAHAVYVGMDYGRVFGPGTRHLPGTQLAGVALGLSGQIGAYGGPWGNANYDVFVAKPILYPSGFPVNTAVAGLSLAVRY